jgi:spore germination protein GerM
MPEKKTSSRSRKRKTGKYTPLIWIITAGVIAFFISYSKTLYDGGFGKLIPTNNSPLNHNTNQAGTPVVNPVAKQTNIVPGDKEIKVSLYLGKASETKVRLVPVETVLPVSQTLLQDTLNLLISYRPDNNLENFIPYQTKIRSVSISGGIAYIDFNDAFGQNSYGTIGYQIQIYQIVYTAAQFTAVKGVSFAINGKEIKYLGGDGYLIRNPIYPFSSLPEFTY